MSTPKYNLTGRVALVTGSSSGIGAAIATQFASYGALVTITGRDEKNLAKVSAKIEEISGTSPLVILGDLLDLSFAPKLVNQTIEHFGRIDILVNNAGWANPNCTFASENLMEGFDKVMGLNLKAPMQMIQLCIPHLEKTKGNVINISSIAAVRPYVLVYSASKAALDMVTKCGASELGPKGIRVNSINPGPIWTEFGRSVGNERFFHQIEDDIKRRAALRKIGHPEEIANLASFLASDDASNITGSTIVNDGGLIIEKFFPAFDEVPPQGD